MPEAYSELIDELARLRGLGEAYYDHRGELRRFSDESRRAILQAMGLRVDDETALRLAIERESSTRTQSQPAAVGGEDATRCYQPPILDTQKCWGLSIQLYTLRSERDWGMGDFADLVELIELAAPLGCNVIGLNPLHALFPADPQHCSPYSPSSRLFLNILYVAVDAIPEFATCPAMQGLWSQASFQAALTALRATDTVMYEQVAALKLCALRLLYDDFRATQLPTRSQRAQSFRQFVTQGSNSLHLHAVFDALDAHLRAQYIGGWQHWPDEFQAPHSPAVQSFIAQHEYEVEFFLYAQWVAFEQLASAQQRARAAGMHIGLYGDLAVGANPSGSEVWSNQSLYVQGAAVGAPPDPLALSGQDWGIPPINPHALREQGFAPFIELLRVNMQSVGALRIDHVMSLFRLWWVPRGFGAMHGVYVHYPLDELVARLVEESTRARCLVIGEDLGTVPDEVRRAMAQRRLFHYKVLLFEKHGDGRFKSPREYFQHALATATTHDLPPLRAWWQGDDLALRDRLGLYPSADTAHQLHNERANDRHAMLRALRDAGLWHWQEHEPLPEFSVALARAIHLYLGESYTALVLVQLEDLIGMTDPVNVPGTHTEHANWQRKIVATTAEIFARNSVQESLRSINSARKGELSRDP
jgi:4-alpha-glucanotransferase